MIRNLPPLNALRAFEAAARHESFSRAAEELGVSHSAVSRHVRGLEHRLATQLFRDLSRGVALSPDGQRYLAAVSPALDQIAEATEALLPRASGVVVVNSEVVFATQWLMPRLRGFKERFADVELRLETTSALVDVARYEADLAVRFMRAGAPEGMSDKLFDSRIGVYAAPEVAAQISRPEDVLQQSMHRDRVYDLWPDWLAAAGSAEVPYQAPAWRFRAMLSIVAVREGDGVILASHDLVEKDVAEGRLVSCFETRITQGAFFLLTGEGAARRKPVRLFREWLLEETAELRGYAGNIQ